MRTEIDKLLAGEPYNARDPEVMRLSADAARACHAFNAADPGSEERRAILRDLIGGWQEYVSIESGFQCAFGKNIHFRGFAMLNFNCTLLDSNIITIGNMALIGPGCSLICTNHAIDHMERRQGLFNNKPITIEDHVWLGANVTVCPGVTIGEGAVIGAGSVVTKDVPPYVVAVGNPCRVLRSITEDDRLAAEQA